MGRVWACTRPPPPLPACSLLRPPAVHRLIGGLSRVPGHPGGIPVRHNLHLRCAGAGDRGQAACLQGMRDTGHIVERGRRWECRWQRRLRRRCREERARGGCWPLLRCVRSPAAAGYGFAPCDLLDRDDAPGVFVVIASSSAAAAGDAAGDAQPALPTRAAAVYATSGRVAGCHCSCVAHQPCSPPGPDFDHSISQLLSFQP